MNDNTIEPVPGTLDAKPKKKRKMKFLFLFAFLLVLTAVAAATCPYFQQQWAKPNAQELAQIEQRLTGMENSVRALDERVNALSIAPQTAPQEEAPPPSAKQPSAAEVARLQSDMVALSAALTALQNEVKESGAHAQRAQLTAQSMVATAVSYFQLRSAALTSQPFKTELAAMRNASPNDADFQKSLNQIEPFAAGGAPTVNELRDALTTLEPQAVTAVDRQQAQNWQDKILAELKSLVSIRRVHGGATDAFGAMENDLAANDLNAALEKTQALPPDAQKVLREWRGKLEARIAVNQALRDLADRFNDLAKAQGVP